MIATDTLLIRHVPAELSEADRESLLKYFGAVQVKSISSRIKRGNTVFAKFSSVEAAKNALGKLHQLEVLGHALTVEFARSGAGNDDLPEGDTKPTNAESNSGSSRDQESFLTRLSAWTVGLNLLQPPPAHLRYQYPPPSPSVLCNISQTLAAVPKFYTQVLHLMNRMNLPSPFEELPTEDESDNVEIKEVVTAFEEQPSEVREVTEDEESEIDSDADINTNEVVPGKRLLPQKKKVKRPKFVKPSSATPAQPKLTSKPEDVFEKVNVEPIQRKIEMKLNPESGLGSSSDSHIAQGSCADTSGFGLLFPTLPPESEEQEVEKKPTERSSKYLTREEIAINKIKPKDLQHLPIFKHYQPGIPSCRLYIKNISKQAEEKDLYNIYRAFISDEQEGMFDVRLMTEGRMKGQAFVTFPSVSKASSALKETNGYILKDKPLVVQFARSAKAN